MSSDTNVLELAYVGDAVYEVYIRKHVCAELSNRVDKMHKKAVRYVSAKGQAKAAKQMVKGFLTEEEIKIVKRGRNHKVTSRPHGADAREYKWATGFEALIGYLELNGEQSRLEEVVGEAIRIIGEKK